MNQPIEQHSYNTNHQPFLACPHCSQHAVVQHGSVYSCLNCGFRRNVTETWLDGKGFLAMLGTGFLLLFLLL